jgi:hypothetical protein
LPEIRIPRLARGHDLRVELRQRLGGVARLRYPEHDRPDAIHLDAVTIPGAAHDEAALAARRHDLLAWPLGLRVSRGCASQGHHDLADSGNSHLRL